MARGVKKEKAKAALTPEEKLAAALVPVEEQPYRVPENWCWTFIRSGFNVTSSKRIHKSDWLSEGIPFYRTRELVKLSEYGTVDNELYISQELYEDCKANYGVPRIGDLLISGVGTIGVPYIVSKSDPFYFKDGNVIWFQSKELILPQYIFYLYKSAFMFNQIHEMSAGTTVDTYTIANAMATMLPLPPYAEQQRIVDRIESLFAKLDEAKEKAQAVVDGFEDRKAVILHKAFIGELSKRWRENHGLTMESWEEKSLKECSTHIGDGLHGTPMFTEGTTFFFVNGNNFAGRFIEIKADTKTVGEEEYTKYRIDLSKDDTVFVSINGTLGKTAFYNDEYIILGKSACYVNVNDSLNKYFLRYYFESKEFLDYANIMATGSTIKNLGLKAMRGLLLAIPSMPEQIEIVRILDGLLFSCQRAKEDAEQTLAQIDTMKKAILARAFRGELGTNDPTDESAEELLKRLMTIEGVI